MRPPLRSDVAEALAAMENASIGLLSTSVWSWVWEDSARNSDLRSLLNDVIGAMRQRLHHRPLTVSAIGAGLGCLCRGAWNA